MLKQRIKAKNKNEAKRAKFAKPSERYELRAYGMVRVRTPRAGIKIEELMPEKKKAS